MSAYHLDGASFVFNGFILDMVISPVVSLPASHTVSYLLPFLTMGSSTCIYIGGVSPGYRIEDLRMEASASKNLEIFFE